MKLTFATLRSLQPCYSPKRFFSEDWKGTLMEVLEDDRIPAIDRIWVFSHTAPKQAQEEFARWCALQVIHIWNAPKVVREYLETGNEEIRGEALDTHINAQLPNPAGTSHRASRTAWRAVYRGCDGSSYSAASYAAEAEHWHHYDNGDGHNFLQKIANERQLKKAIELLRAGQKNRVARKWKAVKEWLIPFTCFLELIIGFFCIYNYERYSTPYALGVGCVVHATLVLALLCAVYQKR